MRSSNLSLSGGSHALLRRTQIGVDWRRPRAVRMMRYCIRCILIQRAWLPARSKTWTPYSIVLLKIERYDERRNDEWAPHQVPNRERMILAILVSLVIKDLSWALPLSFSSNTIPKNLTESTLGISTPCNDMPWKANWLFFLLEKIIVLDLCGTRSKPLERKYEYKISKDLDKESRESEIFWRLE